MSLIFLLSRCSNALAACDGRCLAAGGRGTRCPVTQTGEEFDHTKRDRRLQAVDGTLRRRGLPVDVDAIVTAVRELA